jgi:hypothetical protein
MEQVPGTEEVFSLLLGAQCVLELDMNDAVDEEKEQVRIGLILGDLE